MVFAYAAKRARSMPSPGTLVLRVRLAVFIAVVTLFPVALGTWLLLGSEAQTVRMRLDTQLAGVAQSARPAFARSLTAVEARADRAARSAALQHALITGSLPSLRRLAARDHVAVTLPGGRVVGRIPADAATRSATVTSHGRELGRVTVALPLDAGLLHRLAGAVRLTPSLDLLVVRGTVIAGPGGAVGSTPVRSGTVLRVAGSSYRYSALPLLATTPQTQLLVTAPESLVAAETSGFRTKVLLADVATLATIALLAYLLGVPFLRGLRELLQTARLAHRDHLTGLASRHRFEDALDAELRRADRWGGPVTLLLGDLDDFKRVNDTYGHPAGDAALRHFATVLRESVREIDLPARLGGEEFAVILPATDSGGARRLAERIRAELEARPVPIRGGDTVALTASWGVATAPPRGEGAALLSAADLALYRAKRDGKNTVAFANEEEGVIA